MFTTDCLHLFLLRHIQIYSIHMGISQQITNFRYMFHLNEALTRSNRMSGWLQKKRKNSIRDINALGLLFASFTIDSENFK